MALTLNLINGEWKHNLESDPATPQTSLVSLYDLLYDEEGKAWCDYDDQSKCGIKLSHDIICYQSSIVLSSGAIDTSYPLAANEWQYRGIDIALAEYDARANHKKITKQDMINTSSDYTDQIKPPGHSDFVNIWASNNVPLIYDKDAAIPPKTLELFLRNGIYRNQSSDNVDAETSWNIYKAPSISIGSDTKTTTDIVMSAQDIVFRSTLVNKDGYYAFNKMFVNLRSVYACLMIYRAIGLSQNVFDTSIGTELNNISFISSDITTISETIPKAIGFDNWKKILKNTFVWVRCAFYGDYVNTDSFNQDLNQDSQVVFKDLMLSGAGDFKKYDDFYSVSGESRGLLSNDGIVERNNGRSEDTEPYIPRTSPTVDFYTSNFASQLGYKQPTTNSNYTSKINDIATAELIERSLDQYISGNDAIIQGLPLAAINRRSAIENVGNLDRNLLPPGYFDPESRHIGDSIKSMGKVPTILPSSGNLYVDGRIISPTIDEIWYLVKKLIMGRESDSITNSSTTSPANKTRAVSNDHAIPFGESDKVFNNTDSSLVEVPNSEFTFEYESSTQKYGDPIGHEYRYLNGDKNSKYIYINKFVNNNDSIVYPVYKSLKDISDRVTINDETRKVENFTAWNSIGESEQVVQDNETISSGTWSPRKTPYSLRELEALILGNKYNLITFIRFVKENFTVSGMLGKVSNSDDPYNKSAGSIYQLHSKYNYTVDNPNTWYNEYGSEDGFDEDGNTIGTKSIYNDNDYRTDEEKENKLLRYRRGYGTSSELSDNPEQKSSSRVYMAADGTWRHIDDFIRFPILRDDY